MSSHHVVVMVATSYPRFPGDSVGSFMQPIAEGIAARGHEVHMVVPWHPRWARGRTENGVWFHPFRYAPAAALNTFGYAEGLQADVRLRTTAIAAAPFALAAGWFKALRVAQKRRATLIHAHWVIPGGVMGAAAAGARPLVISLHGSDVFVAEKHAAARAAARLAFRRAGAVTACSDNLRTRAVALGASAATSVVIPYGVDSARFAPNRAQRATVRRELGIADDTPLIVAVGRLVKKKGFEYLIDAVPSLQREFPSVCVAIAGGGDLLEPLQRRAAGAGAERAVRFLGTVSHEDIGALLSAADVAVAPSVQDDAGNVDGLPNTVMEMLASATPLVATRAGGIGAVAVDRENALLVPERNPAAIAAAVAELLRSPELRSSLGARARNDMCTQYGWDRVAAQFDAVYERVR